MKTIGTNFLIISLTAFILISFTSCSSDDDTNVYFSDDKTSGANDNSGNSTTYSYTKVEMETLDVINSYRESIGIGALSKINDMSLQAEKHTDYIIEAGKISHDNFTDRANYLIKNVPVKAVGENVASGFSSARSVVNAWLNSPTHRAIIEDSKYTHTGISIKTDVNGKKYFVQLFAVK